MKVAAILVLFVVCLAASTGAKSLRKRDVAKGSKLTQKQMSDLLHELDKEVKRSFERDGQLKKEIDNLEQKLGNDDNGPKGTKDEGDNGPKGTKGEGDKDDKEDGKLDDIVVDEDPAALLGNVAATLAPYLYEEDSFKGSPPSIPEDGSSPAPPKGRGQKPDEEKERQETGDVYLSKLDEILDMLHYMQEEPFYAKMKTTFTNLDNICGHVLSWIHAHMEEHFAKNYEEFDNMGASGEPSEDMGQKPNEKPSAALDGEAGGKQSADLDGEAGGKQSADLDGEAGGKQSADLDGEAGGKPSADLDGEAGEKSPADLDGEAGGEPKMDMNGDKIGKPSSGRNGKRPAPYSKDAAMLSMSARNKMKRLLEALSRTKRQAGRPNDHQWTVVAGVCFAYEHLAYHVPIPVETMEAYEQP